MKEETKNIVIVGSVLLVSIIFLIVSLQMHPIEPNVNIAEVKTFNSIEEIRSFLEKNSNDGSFAYGGLDRAATLMKDSIAAPQAAVEEGKAGGEAQPSNGAGSYSQTNVQVEGVDEPGLDSNQFTNFSFSSPEH